jgi:hypothetical protein
MGKAVALNSPSSMRRSQAFIASQEPFWRCVFDATDRRDSVTSLTSKHHWLIIACDSCGTMVDLDLSVKARDPEASIRIALRDVQCPRCNGHGRPRIVALARHPSI